MALQFAKMIKQKELKNEEENCIKTQHMHLQLKPEFNWTGSSVKGSSNVPQIMQSYVQKIKTLLRETLANPALKGSVWLMFQQQLLLANK